MYGNKHIGGRKKEMESYYNMVLIYEGIWNYLKKTVIDLKMDITNLRVNTSIPSAKKRGRRSQKWRWKWNTQNTQCIKNKQ